MNPAEAMLAEHGCVSVCTRFYHHLDRRDDQQVASLMAANGVWMRQGKAVTGPQAVLDALAKGAPDRQTRHLLSNVVVTLLDDGKAAHVAYDLAIFVQEGESPARHTAIFTAEDSLDHDGTDWRITRKEAAVVFRLGG